MKDKIIDALTSIQTNMEELLERIAELLLEIEANPDMEEDEDA